MKKAVLLLTMVFSMGMMAQEVSFPNVTVVGEGKVTVVPDEVLIRARVEHEGASVKEVQSKNDKVISDLLAYLKDFGIPSEDVKTEYLRLRKEHNYSTKQDYYSANQALTIKLRDLDDYQTLMAGLLEKGLNRIDGISFSSSKEDELKAEARRKAVLDAREKAEQYAQALGQEIGEAWAIREQGAQVAQPVFRQAAMKVEAFDSAASGPEIAPGEMEINTQVNVSFQLKVRMM